MNWLFKLNNFFRIWGATFRAMARIKIWIPLIILVMIQAILLYQLVNFYQPPLGPILVPLLKAFLPEKIMHYPQYYLSLPLVFNMVNLILVGFFSIFANSMVIWLLASRFWGEKLSLKQAWAKVKGQFKNLFLIWVVNTLAAAAVIFLPALLFSSWMAGSPRRIFFIQSVSLVLGILVSGLFAYCFNAILLSGASWLKSLSMNLGIFRRNFFSTCFFIGIPGLISWSYGILVGNSPLLISKFRPDIIPLLLMLGSLINIFVLFWILGSLTRLYLYEIKEVQ